MSTFDIAPVSLVCEAPVLHLQDIRASFARVPSLDGLRAVSIVLVMLSHYVDSRLFPGGLGVLIFFVVSGYLITRLLFAEAASSGRIGLRNFYLRRFFRLYPVVTAYVLVVVLYFAMGGRRLDWYEPASVLFYFSNYLYAWQWQVAPVFVHPMPFAIFWSLSVEEHFYLLFPFLFILVPRRALVPILAAICAICFATRASLALIHPEWIETHIFYYSDMRLDSIAFGVILAAICETPHGARIVEFLAQPLTVLSALGAIVFCLLCRDPLFRETVRYSLLGASTAVILAAVIFSGRYRAIQVALNQPFVRWVGILSYSLYVWHTFLPIVLHDIAPRLWRPMEAPILFGLSLVAAAISYHCFETPVAALRQRFGSMTRPLHDRI